MSKFLNYVALGLALAIGYLLIVGQPNFAEMFGLSKDEGGAQTDIIPETDVSILAGGDPVAGQTFYDRSCSACHSVEPKMHGTGPSMFGVVGRPAGRVADYPYSSAMQAVDYDWSVEMLSGYLTDPRAFLPGTTMAYVGIRDPHDTADVIAFLETLAAR